MTEPRIVTSQEVQRYRDEEGPWPTWDNLAHTVATEPDRIRAAVVQALREASEQMEMPAQDWLVARVEALENGADL